MSGYGPSQDATPSNGDPAQLIRMTSYVATALGALAFIWGFLSWFTDGSDGISGFSVYGAGATAVIGLSLVAGLLAAAATLEARETTSLTPTVLALAAFLLAVGILIDKGSVGANANVGAGVGLILAVITTALQTAALGYGWLLASGRVTAPAQRPKAAPNPWGGAQSGPEQSGYGGYLPGPGSYGGGQYQPPTYQQQPPNQQPSYQPPAQQQPYYQQPASQQPTYPPGTYQQPTYSPPDNQRPAAYQPPAAPRTDDAEGYSDATRHLPRYPASESSDPPDGDTSAGN